MSGVSVGHPRCPYCHDAIQPQQVKTPCMTCMAWHHSDCAEEHERCAACGDRTADPKSRQRAARPRRAPRAARKPVEAPAQKSPNYNHLSEDELAERRRKFTVLMIGIAGAAFILFSIFVAS